MIFPRWLSRPLILPALALCLVLSAALSSCDALPATGTPSPSPIPATETPTIVWFPPTRTPTFTPTYLPPPTIEPPPGLGSLIFADDFSNPSLWNAASSASASAGLTNNRLSLSLTSGPLTILSLRSEPLLGDFYLEATARLSLCRGTDQYGLLFRAAPGGTYYRLVLACNGSLRFERVRGGGAPEVLQNWLPSGDVPTGAPGEVRLGLWASGTEFRIFLNDHFQFSLRDPVLRTGTLGFFASASGGTPVLVSFSELEVYTVVWLSPTPSLTPSRTPLP